MPKPTSVLGFMLLLPCFSLLLQAQEPATVGLNSPSIEQGLVSLSGKTIEAEEQLHKTTEKYLGALLREETQLRKKLWKKDSALANRLFNGVEEKYAVLKNFPGSLRVHPGVYSGHLDTLTTSLKFLDAEGCTSPELKNLFARFSSLGRTINQTEAVKQFLRERKRLLQENLERLGLLKELKGFSKQAYYYAAQVKEYKTLWENPSRLKTELLKLVLKNEKFGAFFRKHSQLGSLFALPASGNSAALLQGLQTRASVQQAVAARFGSGVDVQQLLLQNVQNARAQLDALKSNLTQYESGSYGNGSANIDVPDGFSPNPLKTKTFLQRLEYGANVQSQKARSYFPVTSDIGLSLGYKLNAKSSVGIGASCKVGWGRNWNNIRLTSEGIGLRSYLDYRLKGSLYVSGGYEQNYRSAFYSVRQLRDYSAWQPSGLLGLSKKYKVSKKVKGEVKLLWDFLSYQQVPKTQALLFRIGYIIK